MKNATSSITIPASTDLQRRIEECRDELNALKRLHRMAKAAEQAAEARSKREREVVPA
jgi:hypothetical protein